MRAATADLLWAVVIALAFIVSIATCVAFIGIDNAILASSRHREATWVSEAHDFGVSKSGRVWRQEEWTAAMKGTADLGRWKRVALVDEPDRPVYVLVTDRLPDSARADIDLSKGATLLLGGTDLLNVGRFKVTIQDAR